MESVRTGIAKRRRWLPRLALLTGSLVLVIGVLEVGARVLWPSLLPGYPNGLFVSDDSVGYRLARGFSARQDADAFDIDIRISSRGYRGPELRSRSDGHTRIFSLGDSFAFGHGVENEETYSTVMESLLGADGWDVEAINGGVPGYGTDNELAMFWADSEELDPEIVLLGVYVGNDFRSHPQFGTIEARSGVLITVEDGIAPGWWQCVKTDVLVYSRLAQAIFLTGGGETITEEEVIQLRCDQSPWDPAFTFSIIRSRWDQVAQDGFDITMGRIEALSQACDASGRRLLVILLPGPVQYDMGLWNTVLGLCNFEPEDYDVTRPNRDIVAWCAERNIEVLDLLPAFTARAAEPDAERLYIDVHFSSAGHRLAGEVIAEHIRGWKPR